MTKNITVIGNNNEILYSTYRKRAVGLVKKGRADWVGDNSIRMRGAAEEIEMANNIYDVFDNQMSKMQEQLRDCADENAMSVRVELLKSLNDMSEREMKLRMTERVIAQVKEMYDDFKAETATDDAVVLAEREQTRRFMLNILGKALDGDNSDAEKSAN